jgi:4-hydroxybenzoate polyprenyltransferase
MTIQAALVPYLQLIRAPAIFTAISNILAAHLIATQGAVQWSTLLLLSLASMGLYAGGMALNDVFDAAEDARDRPQRPIPSGRITLGAARALGFGLLTGGAGLAALAGTTQAIIGLLLAGLIVFYDGYAKHTALAAPAMASCRFFNWLLGLSVGALTPAVILVALPVFIYIASLTALSRVETTAKSRTPLVICGAGLVVTAVAILPLRQQWTMPDVWVVLLVVLGLTVALRRLWATYAAYTPAEIQKTVATLVLGVIPLDAIIAVTAGPWWGGLLVFGLWFPGRFIARFMRVS